MTLTGNTIVITGGTSGIGKELAEKLLARGNTLIICGRRAERLQEMTSKYPKLAARACDVTDESQRKAFADWVASTHPDVNVLVNNAGIQLLADLTTPLDVARVRAEVETNVVAPLHFASLFAPLLARKPGAAIVNLSSGLAFSPLAFMPVYCATKAAVHSFSLSMRHQMKRLGIAVFEIAPPGVDSELGRERWSATGATSHGGMPVAQFVDAMLAALEKDVLEAGIGDAEGMRQKREALFGVMNRS